VKKKDEGGRFELPRAEGEPIWQAAVEAHHAGASIFTCAVIVTTTSGGALGTGGKMTTKLKHFSPDSLLAAIEAAGWDLASADHVWMQTSHNAMATGRSAIIEGMVQANYLFRRRVDPTPRGPEPFA